MSRQTRVALTIAGSDPSGGAGVQADLKTFHQHAAYGCAVITLLTVQNTLGVQHVELVSPDLVGAQLDAVLSDMPVASIKTGALGSSAIVERVAHSLRTSSRAVTFVIDPVGFSKNKQTLLAGSARQTLLTQLLPLATLITPNLEEAAWLTGREVNDEASIRDAASWLRDAGARHVLIKGGHREGAPIDLLLAGDGFHELHAQRVDTKHTHGVGCSLSAAITARLAHIDHRESMDARALLHEVTLAKQWITEAIASAPWLGAGAGPLNHFAKIPS